MYRGSNEPRVTVSKECSADRPAALVAENCFSQLSIAGLQLRCVLADLQQGSFQLRAARDDAASFVASNGAIRGAQLEAAFVAVRAQYPAARNVSDQELAAAILAP